MGTAVTVPGGLVQRGGVGHGGMGTVWGTAGTEDGELGTGDSPGDTSLCWTLIPGGSFCPREAGGLREEERGSCAGDGG